MGMSKSSCITNLKKLARYTGHRDFFSLLTFNRKTPHRTALSLVGMRGFVKKNLGMFIAVPFVWPEGDP